MTESITDQTTTDDVDLDATLEEVPATGGAEGDPGVNADDQDTDTTTGNEGTADEEVDMFPRPVVEKLRKENAGYRDRAKTAEARADTLARRLHAALVAADGRVADPDDVEFNPDHLDDPDALAATITALIERKPGLKAMRLGGDIGAGNQGTPKPAPADLIGLIRNSRA